MRLSVLFLTAFFTLFTPSYCIKAESVVFTQDGLVCKEFQGDEAKKYIPVIMQFHAQVFGEFPYLYDGSYDETEELTAYFNAESAVLLVIFDGDQIAGISRAICLNDDAPTLSQPMATAGFDPKQCLYVSEVTLKLAYRGKKLLTNYIAQYYGAFAQNNYSHAAFISSGNSYDHPTCPTGYRSPEHIWKKFGFEKIETPLLMQWGRRDTGKVEDNVVYFWVKKLQ